MNRRNFIKITGFGLGAVVLGSTIVSYTSSSAPVELYGWNGPSEDEQDIRMQVLAYAILCPNPHNKQPWIIDMTGPLSFNLYVDPERLLPATDPFYRQIHIGQGTFLETLAIAATGLGYQAKFEYFPEGEYGNTEMSAKPVAAIELIKQPSIEADPLFAHLLTRHSNKRQYDNNKLNDSELSQLHDFHGQNQRYPLTTVDSKEAKAELERILTDAMRIEVGDEGRDQETIAMFRFNDDEINKFRDGFGVAQTGMTGLKKFVVEKFLLDRESVEKDPTSFGEQSVDITQKAASSTATFGWITSTGNSRLDQVKVGREYCRLNLKTTEMGLAQHPMSQVLQEYHDMLPLQAEFKKIFNINQSDTVQMLFRLGHAEPTPHGPRRLVTEMIRNS